MPITLKTSKTEAPEERADEAKKLALFTEEGTLTLAGRTIADFLEAADFDALFDLEAGQPYVVNPAVTEDDPYAVSEADDEEGGDEEGDDAEDGDGEKSAEPEAEADADADGDAAEEDEDEETAEAILPGVIAAQLVDEDDLAEMFSFYLSTISESVDEAEAGEEGLTERKAVLAVFRSVLEDADGSKEEVTGWLREMLESGMVVTDEVNEKFLTKGERVKRAKKAKKPKSGALRAKNKKRKRERKKNKAKLKRQAAKLGRKRKSRNDMLARQRSEDTALVFGAGWGLEEAELTVGVREDVELELTREQLIDLDEQYGLVMPCPSDECEHSAPVTAFIDEMKMKKKKSKKPMMGGGAYESSEEGDEAVHMQCPECEHTFEGKVPDAFKKHMKKKKGDKGKDADGDDDGSKKGEKDEGLGTHGSPFAIAAGRPGINEGASIAASVLGKLAGPKTLNG